nr:hypothetical protein [Marinicella sp. W31]MDC2878244.1 hypothetical protein [Marinicella sp. W31]
MASFDQGDKLSIVPETDSASEFGCRHFTNWPIVLCPTEQINLGLLKNDVAKPSLAFSQPDTKMSGADQLDQATQ